MSTRGSAHPPAGRDLVSAGQGMAMASVALNAAMSQAMGLHPSEGLCVWHVTESAYGEPVTAGRLAEVTGLTTGAITGIIDRLEAAGFVRRERGAADRRKVFIRPVLERMAEIGALMEPMEQAFGELAGCYRSDELAVIRDYLDKARQVVNEQIERIRAMRLPASPSAGRNG
jgi:DNA-binding MarR family transcriptional regulator